MSTYPRDRAADRRQIFAHRFARLLFKSCAIQRLGKHAALLVLHIAHTEDAARYSGPVTFWNSQLMETLGFSSPKQLGNARAIAVDLGWLHYDRGGTRVVGNYWVTIPPNVAKFSDTPIEEPQEILSPGGTNPDSILSQRGTNCGTNSGMNCGKLPNPIPFPIPSSSCPGQAPDASTLAEPREPKPSRHSPEDVAVAEWFAGCIAKLQPTRKEIQPDRKPATVKKWADVIRLMREQDKRTHEQIRHLFERVQRDEFWRRNVLSPAKLREKWDDLALKLANGTGKPAPAPPPRADIPQKRIPARQPQGVTS